MAERLRRACPTITHGRPHGEQGDVSPLTTPIHHPPPILAKRAQALRSIAVDPARRSRNEKATFPG